MAGDAAYASLIVIALVDLYLTNIVDISMSLTRMRRKPWRFAFYALTRGLTYVTLAVLLVAVWELGVKGIMIASLTSACPRLRRQRARVRARPDPPASTGASGAR